VGVESLLVLRSLSTLLPLRGEGGRRGGRGGDRDLLLTESLEERKRSWRGERDRERDLKDLPPLSLGSLGPSLEASRRSLGGEERNRRRSSPNPRSLASSLSGSLMGVVESASIFASASAGGKLSSASFAAGLAGLMYSLVSTTVNSISTKLLVSFCRKTSICETIDSFSSSTVLSFLIRASTYLARAAGSASHRGSRCEVSQLLSSSCFSINMVT